MEIDDILSQFGRFSRPAVREAVARREDVTPALLGAAPRNAPQSARKAPAGVILQPRGAAKVGGNDPCPYGSGKKFKECCGA